MRRALAALALAAAALALMAGPAAAQKQLTAKQVATALQARNAGFTAIRPAASE